MRKLRISGYKDYVAVDIVSEGKVVSTPFYLKKGEVKTVQYKDQEELRAYITDVKISEDFSKLNCKDREGLEWDSPFEELLDENIIRFI